MTIDDLLAKVPTQFRGVASQYGPALIAMTAQEFSDWLNMLLNGKTREAWAALTAKLDNAGLVAAFQEINANWEAADNTNAANVALQKKAATAVMGVLLTAVLAMVGL